jgi:hypothetical protein
MKVLYGVKDRIKQKYIFLERSGRPTFTIKVSLNFILHNLVYKSTYVRKKGISIGLGVYLIPKPNN